MIIIGFSPRNL